MPRPDSSEARPLVCDATQVVAVDLGGTVVRGALIDVDGSVRERRRQYVRTGRAADQVADMIRDLAARLSVRKSDGAVGDVVAVLGVAGRVNRVAGTVDFARNLRGNDLRSLSADSLQRTTGLQVRLMGDVELAALGEALAGAGTADGTTAYLTFSTGVGAAAVHRGALMSGDIVGFQIGFLSLLGPGTPMIDELASGQRLSRLARDRGMQSIDAEWLIQHAALGEPDAVSAVHEIETAASAAALLMCHTCSPDSIVVGGGLAVALGESLLRVLKQAVNRDYTSVVGRVVEVRKAELGDDAALVGAAIWVRNTMTPMRGAATDRAIDTDSGGL